VKKVNILLIDYRNPESCWLNGVEKEDLICEGSEPPYLCRPKPIDASLGSFTIEKLSQVRCYLGTHQMPPVVDISPGTQQFKIQIESAEDPLIFDLSDNYFSIVSATTATSTSAILKSVGSQLASVSEAVSQLMERVAELTKKR